MRISHPSDALALQPGGLVLEATLLCAGPSLNGTYYPISTIAGAAPHFRGVRCYLDHSADVVRSVTEIAGAIEAAWFDGDRIRGRIRLSEAHPELTTLVREGLAGELSITAAGVTRLAEREGRLYRVVESLTEIQSVDFVTAAAAGGRVERILQESRIWDDALSELQHIQHERTLTWALLLGH